MSSGSAAEREWALFDGVDRVAREVLAAADPWVAYSAAGYVSGLLIDHLTWMPHGGRVYVTWAVLLDLFEIGETHWKLRTTCCDAPRRSG